MHVKSNFFFVSFQMLRGFKIIIGSKSNNNYLKFNDDFKSQITFVMTQKL